MQGHGLPVRDLGHDWQGGLNFTYYTGPAGLAHMHINNSFSVSPVWNVIARIPGESEPDKEIILGNHRDAWVYGAVDPSSGTAVMLEVAHGLGFLYQMGTFFLNQ